MRILCRAFLAIVAACLPLVALAQSPSPAPRADLVILGASVKTMNPDSPTAEAVAVVGDRIAYVGDDAGARAMIGPKTRVIRASGRTLTPGFIDSHMHPRPVFDEMGPFGVLDLTPEGGVTSRAKLLAKVAAKAAVTPNGAPILGRGYYDDLVGGHPDARTLDAVAPNHPLILTHSSGHRSVVNSRALAEAGVTRDTPDPAGGKFERDASGEPTGIILERAAGAFSKIRERAPKPEPAALRDGYMREFRGFAAYGITSIGDAGLSPEKLSIYRDLIGAGMPIQIYAMVRAEHVDWLVKNRELPEWRVPGLTMRAVKLFHGNSLSGKTAWLYEPYASDPTYYGVPPRMSQDELNAAVKRVHDAGLQAAIHSNGDREIDMVLTAFEAAQSANPRTDARHRIEHASIVNQGILDRIKRDGIAIAPHSYEINHGEKFEAFGEKRFEWMHPNKRALDMGIPAGGNSDHPVSPPKVMERIESLVTRQARTNGKVYGPGQTISPDQALWLWTMGSAYLQFEEAAKGSISKGKRADLVLLSDDPARIAPSGIEAIRVLTTIIGGKVAFERRNGRETFGF
jgi:predicted amidohydrolase YtcJ